MKNIIIKTLLILACISFTQSLNADEKSVIVVGNNVDISNLSKNDLENIFLGRKTLWSDGQRIQIALSTENSQRLDEFLVDNIGQNERRFKKYWLKKVFAGYGIAPKIFSSNEKAIEFAKDQKASITYITVDDEKMIEGVKIIAIDGTKYF